MKSCKAELPVPATFPPTIQYRQGAKISLRFCHTVCVEATGNSTKHFLTDTQLIVSLAISNISKVLFIALCCLLVVNSETPAYQNKQEQEEEVGISGSRQYKRGVL